MQRQNYIRTKRKGIALVVAMIFIAVFMAMAAGMVSMSSANAQTAQSMQNGNLARSTAESGLEMLRYILVGVSITGRTSEALCDEINEQLSAMGMNGGVVAELNPVTDIINFSEITLDGDQEIGIQLQKNGYTLVAWVTGSYKELARTIVVNFDFVERGRPAFDYGIATKGPLLMSGQTSVSGVNLAVESDVFIDTSALGDSFAISNQASVAGNVHIVNRYASYSVGKKSSVGGETGSGAEDHVYLGVDAVDFPAPDADYFRQYATGAVIDSTSNLNNFSVLNNVTIAANTNPTFASHIKINGVLFIEKPNNVTFSGQVDVQGVIAGESEVGESVGSLKFSGQVECFDVSELQGNEFSEIRQEVGTFIMAPGFSADFSGQATTINGVIAVGGVRFTGQAGGTINGSIINYSQDPMILQGQSELLFNRSGTETNPAGFQPVFSVEFNPASYSEVCEL